MNEAYNMDCMEFMRSLPDKAFDLAVVDPPYGDGCSQTVQVEREREREEPASGIQEADSSDTNARQVTQHRAAPIPCGGAERKPLHEQAEHGPRSTVKKIIAWDVAPGKEYFDELFRVSRNQIIWGGNYFSLPPTRCFLVWRKLTISDNFTMAMCEYAWTSFSRNAKLFECAPQGRPGERFHLTQKPVALYRWIYQHFAKPGDKILDTHLGSGSSRIAAWDAGLDFVGCEIDETYFALEEQRFQEHTAQMNLFVDSSLRSDRPDKQGLSLQDGGGADGNDTGQHEAGQNQHQAIQGDF